MLSLVSENDLHLAFTKYNAIYSSVKIIKHNLLLLKLLLNRNDVFKISSRNFILSAEAMIE